MSIPTILVATWRNGLRVFENATWHEECPGESIRVAARSERGDGLVIVGGKSLRSRSAAGSWNSIANGEVPLACCVAVGASIYAGTDDAQVMRVRDGGFERLDGFDQIEGRESWYAGSALIDGRVVGPPLGVRSMTATCDRAAILAGVHVGGIARSLDRGATWQPTIDIDCDVHQVCAHPRRREIVAAAAGVGLCLSRDGGTTWKVYDDGLHAPHCSAVAFAGDDILVSASADPFDPQGAIYRRPIDQDGPMQQVGDGLPRWLKGIADTGNIAARDHVIAIADWEGNLYVSEDAGGSWTLRGEGISDPSGLFIY